MKFFILIISAWIGMNLWLIPQISEHFPNIIPGLFCFNWFGMQSIFISIDGIVHEWITSMQEVIIVILWSTGVWNQSIKSILFAQEKNISTTWSYSQMQKSDGNSILSGHQLILINLLFRSRHFWNWFRYNNTEMLNHNCGKLKKFICWLFRKDI